MITSRQNQAIEAAVIAVARAHCQMPGFDRGKAVEIATKIDDLLKPERTLEAIFATCVVLLRLIGYNARAALAAASAAAGIMPDRSGRS